MNRQTPWTTIIIVLVALACLAAVAAPSQAVASPLKSQLHRAQIKLKQAHTRLVTAEAALLAAQTGGTTSSTGGTVPPAPVPAPAPPTVEQLQAQVAKAKAAVARWNAKVGRLAKAYRQQQRLATWVAHSKWRPIITIAAAKYHVKAAGMYRMMMRESAGQRYAGSNTSFKGLFQYYTGTWASGWNPWRHVNIYDPVAQINATAYAIHKGMGPSMWTTTWASCY